MSSEQAHPDDHPLDPYVKIFASRCFLLSSSILVTVLSVAIAICTKNVGWINRGGALLVVIGLLFTMSPLFARGIYKAQSSAAMFASRHSDGTAIATTAEDREIGKSVGIGVVVTIIGTIANAFGDLIAQGVANLVA